MASAHPRQAVRRLLAGDDAAVAAIAEASRHQTSISKEET